MALRRRRNKTPAPPRECPLTVCMSLLRGTWTPDVIWYLGSGPRRFSELRADLSGVSAKVLTARLRELQARGVVTRHSLPTSPPSVEYALSELGQELLPALRSIVAVGERLERRASELQRSKADSKNASVN